MPDWIGWVVIVASVAWLGWCISVPVRIWLDERRYHQ